MNASIHKWWFPIDGLEFNVQILEHRRTVGLCEPVIGFHDLPTIEEAIKWAREQGVTNDFTIEVGSAPFTMPKL